MFFKLKTTVIVILYVYFCIISLNNHIFTIVFFPASILKKLN